MEVDFSSSKVEDLKDFTGSYLDGLVDLYW